MKYGKNNLKAGIEEQFGECKVDKVIELIKMLHCEPNIEAYYCDDVEFRKNMIFGTTKKDAALDLGVDERTIYNMIMHLDPTKRPATVEPYYIAGQPINIPIDEIRINNNRLRRDYDKNIVADRKVRFCSKGSMHPVFMQLNVTQLGALLRALAADYDDNRTDITLGIGAYLYSQLSTYAQERLVKVYGQRDPKIDRYIKAIDEMEESDFKNAFMSESEYALLEHEDINMDLLMAYVKNGWKCNIEIRRNGRNEVYNDVSIDFDGNNVVILLPDQHVVVSDLEIARIEKVNGDV